MQPVASVLLSLAALAAAAPSSERRAVAADNSSPFQVYAYGTGIGGLAMFSSGGDAYFGDHTKLNDTQAAPVIFTPNDNNTWTGAPNTTAIGNSTTPPTWSNLPFSIPSETSGSHDVGFSNSSSTDRQTSGFTFYGTFIFVDSTSGGGMESLWYATPSSVDGIYNLKWNQTGDDSANKITLTLKKTPPSNAQITTAEAETST
ncbi:hypothetical protein CGLO_17114 [Colletotrichum gloeosporioides Cg-14]|uniref:Uncharacterized protein n=1 Tax=Colletotrichum gloeosporioides (strain Cg-14) TaxID=1237896 RepID=T0JXG3_COLGC|nr:hypothetical protein CGLO_17114 [Colletotrichum gloeosporioides Cg-14]